MDNAFIRFGHGYEISERGRCEAFDGFEIIADPLGGFDTAARESRVFRTVTRANAVTYASHAIKLARQKHDGALYILMHHGGGREVLRVPEFYDGGALHDHIIALPARLQYALLYAIWQTASNARHEAQRETRAEWAQAIAERRIRRRKGRVEIVPQWEIDFKAQQKARKVA